VFLVGLLVAMCPLKDCMVYNVKDYPFHIYKYIYIHILNACIHLVPYSDVFLLCARDVSFEGLYGVHCE